MRVPKAPDVARTSSLNSASLNLTAQARPVVRWHHRCRVAEAPSTTASENKAKDILVPNSDLLTQLQRLSLELEQLKDTNNALLDALQSLDETVEEVALEQLNSLFGDEATTSETQAQAATALIPDLPPPITTFVAPTVAPLRLASAADYLAGSSVVAQPEVQAAAEAPPAPAKPADEDDFFAFLYQNQGDTSAIEDPGAVTVTEMLAAERAAEAAAAAQAFDPNVREVNPDDYQGSDDDPPYAEFMQPPVVPKRRLNIVFAAAEVAPWSKTGGLGDVMGADRKSVV